LFGKNKAYNIYAYDSIKTFTLTVKDDTILIEPTGVGLFLLKENIEYKNQIDGDSLILRLLSNEKINILDAAWEKEVSLLDNTKIDVRFLFSEEKEIFINNKKVVALLYRMDIKSQDKKFDENNLVNKALINSSIRKVWVDKSSESVIKINIMYNRISYIININEN
tara:strand:- start:1043 stop:1540 length:498 start_codon:yes stop_codon:yes gene_type:complete